MKKYKVTMAWNKAGDIAEYEVTAPSASIAAQFAVIINSDIKTTKFGAHWKYRQVISIAEIN